MSLHLPTSPHPPAGLQVQHLLPQPAAGPLAALQPTVSNAAHAVLQPRLIAQVVQHRHLREWLVAAAACGAACADLAITVAEAEGGVCDGAVVHARLQL